MGLSPESLPYLSILMGTKVIYGFISVVMQGEYKKNECGERLVIHFPLGVLQFVKPSIMGLLNNSLQLHIKSSDAPHIVNGRECSKPVLSLAEGKHVLSPST